MKHQIGAIVIGGHFQGLGVIRALARMGVPVALLDTGPCISRFSKYIKRFYECSPVNEEESFLYSLRKLANKHGMKGWVVFPTDDETVYVLARHREQLQELFRISTPPWDVVKFAYDKKRSYQKAERIGIKIPRTLYTVKEKDLEKIDLPFPVIIKPTVMRRFFKATGKKVFSARNFDELKSMYRQAAEVIDPSEILIQEEIPDVSDNLYSFCPLFKDGKVLARVIAKRSRQHPMDFGQASTFVVTMNIPELEELGTKFLREIDYYGLCEVEFIKDPRDGIFKFLEVNPRIWGWHTIALRAGVNLPYMLYLDMINRSVIKESFKEGIKWVRLVTDLPTAASEIIKGRMGLKQYIRSIHGEKEFAVYSCNDPMPFFGELLMLPYLWKKRGF
jgi:predicted ATP-grasp superfamily ATP-dependent carboligase